MTFIILSVGIAVFTVLFLVIPLFSRQKQQAVAERDAVNVESAAIRLSELKQELSDGQITEEQFQRFRLELETFALEDLRNNTLVKEQDHKGNAVLAIVIALFVPLLSISIYQKLGNEQSLYNQAQSEDAVHSMDDLNTMLASMEADLERKPDDLKSWIVLGQAYFELGRFNEAANAFEKSHELRPEDVDILVNYAEAIGRAHENNLLGKPHELLNKALKLMPNHERALWLAGFAEMQADNTEAAIKHWRHLLAGLETDSEAYRQLEKLVNEVDSGDSSFAEVIVTESDEVKSSITVNVSLASELQNKVDADTTLFIFARASKGPAMPLAVYRGLAKDLPLTVTLDDSMAMMPEMSLSKFPEVVIGARLSTNGQPQGQAGDFEGYSEIIETNSTPEINIVINKIKP